MVEESEIFDDPRLLVNGDPVDPNGGESDFVFSEISSSPAFGRRVRLSRL